MGVSNDKRCKINSINYHLDEKENSNGYVSILSNGTTITFTSPIGSYVPTNLIQTLYYYTNKIDKGGYPVILSKTVNSVDNIKVYSIKKQNKVLFKAVMALLSLLITLHFLNLLKI